MVANWIYLLVVKAESDGSKITFPVSGEADQLGTLYSVDPWDKDRGQGPWDLNWHTLYMPIHSTCVSINLLD